MSTPIRRSSRLQRLSLSRGEENQDVPIIITKNKSVRKPKKVLTNVVNTITEVRWNNFKGGPDHSHFIFEINVGKSRIRHRTTLKLNNLLLILSRSRKSSFNLSVVLGRIRLFPTSISKIKWLKVLTTLKISYLVGLITKYLITYNL